ncbi:hypothetical protein HELRODRAFT_161224 [Helobdella robusta]|uniref:Lysosome-associated membrane glycoprotein 2-like transmembrane domain-containing protein n=1 Tax=Helobdella robusta TaxID=6412 RepID=T1ER84_HELRO|nr:hypothetical protein HELRODRAFT_161224 [Helobdella robusta]ESO02005.1 hypothetical protein HELRODRAFT_161224 [Helobdella robusta]
MAMMTITNNMLAFVLLSLGWHTQFWSFYLRLCQLLEFYDCEPKLEGGRGNGVPPTTTAKPPSVVYHVNNSKEVCILMSADVTIVLYDKIVNKTKEAPVQKIDEVSGDCGPANSSAQFIKLTFFSDWSLKFVFAQVDNKNYRTSEVRLEYDTQTFPADELPFKINSSMTLNVTDYGNLNGQEYICDAGLELSGTLPAWNTTTITAIIKNIKLEAFRHNITTLNFNTNGVKNCASSDSNTLIPIIVGSVLIALIIIVLIAYLISRRTRRTGYESV